MELWIRSQDKTKLVKVNSLWVMDNQIWMEVPFYENHKKLGLTVSGCNHKLATYKTKERAIEVLDEIQNFICIEIHENNINYEEADLILKGKIVDSLCKVYQMPKN